MLKTVIVVTFSLVLTNCNSNNGSNNKTKLEAVHQTSQSADIRTEDQYANIESIYFSNDSCFIKADYIQYLTGDKAIEAARREGYADVFVNEKGDTSYAVPNDYFFVNESKKIRNLLLSKDADFELVINPERKPSVIKNDFQTFQKIYKDSPFILTLNNGEVVKVTEVFLP